MLSNQDKVLSFHDMLWTMLVDERQDVEMVAKVVCIAWAMWPNRNEVRHGGQRRNGKEMVRWAFQYMEEYKAVTESLSCRVEVVEERGTWTPPPVNIFKINVDDAVFADKKVVGVGVIIRDDKGRIEAEMCKKIPILLGTMEAEAMASLRSILAFMTLSLKVTRSSFTMRCTNLPIHLLLWLLLYKACRSCARNFVG